MQTAIGTGFLVGGSLGAAVGFFMAARQTGGEESSDDGLAGYPSVRRNSVLRMTLHDMVPLFKDLDRATNESLLGALEKICQLYESCKSGDARPVVVAQALEAKRRASSALAVLSRKARQQRPMAASDLSEDLQALKKFLEDQLYNISQEQSLQSSSRVIQ
jgi:hypothetical protein